MGADVATLRVIGKTVVADDVLTLELAAPSGGRLRDWTPGLAHRPGAAQRPDPAVLAVRRPLGPVHLPRRRPARAGRPRRLRLRARRAGGRATVVGVGGPRNNFPLVPSERYLFVAGGIGITPLLPMIAPGRPARRGLAAALRRPPPRLDGLPRRARGVRRPRAGACRRTSSGCSTCPASSASRAPACGSTPAARPRCSPRWRRACADWPPHALRTERFVADEHGAPARTAPFEVELARSGRDRHRHPRRDRARGASAGWASRCCPPAGRASAAPARRRCSRAGPTTATRCSTTTSATPATACTSASPAPVTDRLVLDL